MKPFCHLYLGEVVQKRVTKKFILIIALLICLIYPVSAYVKFETHSGINGWFDQAGGYYNLTDGSSLLVSGLHTYGGPTNYAIGPYAKTSDILAYYGWSSTFRMIAYTCTGINETHCDQIGDNGYGTSGSWNYIQSTMTTASVVHDWIIIRFVNSGYGDPHTVFKISKNNIPPESSFSCVPIAQTVNNGVVCTDNSTYTPTNWYWTIDMDSIGYKAWQTSTSRNFTWYSSYIGTYGVNLRANNSEGSDWENKSSYVTIYNSTTIQNTVTLTPSPNTCNPGDLVTFTTTCSNVTACTGPNGMHFVSYTEHFPAPSFDFRNIAMYHYNTTSAGWDYRVLSTDPWQVGSFNPLTGAHANPTISGNYTYYVGLSKDNYVSLGQGMATVEVQGSVSGSLNMRFDSQDQTTGGHLSNTQMNLTNANTLVRTEWGIVPDFKTVSLPRGQDYTVRCSKTGYLDGSNDFSVPMNPDIEDGDMGTFVSCPLYPTGSISAGNTTVTVKVFDAENYIPLPNVQVQMSAPIIYSDSPKYTGGDGSGVFFILGQNQPYSVTASKSGYCAVTDTGNTSTLNTKNVYLNLKYGSCMGPTPTPTPTPGPTGTGGPGVIVTPTTFQAGNATTFWRPWINVFNMMGANAGEINMLLAGLIIVLLMAVGGGVAGVLGAEVFMGFGAIFCVAVGLIPIWVVLAIIILGFLFYGLKIGR